MRLCIACMCKTAFSHLQHRILCCNSAENKAKHAHFLPCSFQSLVSSASIPYSSPARIAKVHSWVIFFSTQSLQFFFCNILFFWQACGFDIATSHTHYSCHSHGLHSLLFSSYNKMYIQSAPLCQSVMSRHTDDHNVPQACPRCCFSWAVLLIGVGSAKVAQWSSRLTLSLKGHGSRPAEADK